MKSGLEGFSTCYPRWFRELGHCSSAGWVLGNRGFFQHATGHGGFVVHNE